MDYLEVMEKIKNAEKVFYNLHWYDPEAVLQAIKRSGVDLDRFRVDPGLRLREAVKRAKARGLEPTAENLLPIRWEEVQLSVIGATATIKFRRALRDL